MCVCVNYISYQIGYSVSVWSETVQRCYITRYHRLGGLNNRIYFS